LLIHLLESFLPGRSTPKPKPSARQDFITKDKKMTKLKLTDRKNRVPNPESKDPKGRLKFENSESGISPSRGQGISRYSTRGGRDFIVLT
jgi:hypothetical protein